MTILTERLRIEPFCEQDAEFVLSLLNDETFIRHIADKGVRTLDGAVEYLRNSIFSSYRDNGFGLYKVSLSASGTPIGMVGLVNRDELEHPDLGYALLADFAGKGYAVEASNAVLKEARHKWQLSNVLAVTFPDNQRSNQLLQRLGFELIGSKELYGRANNLYCLKL